MPGRNFRFTRKNLQQVVDNFRPGLPQYREHGIQLLGVGVSQELRQRKDGEWEVFGVFDVYAAADESEESVLARLERGVSPAFLENGADAPESPVLTLGFDSLAFTEEDLNDARAALRNVEVATYVTWYHQLAAEPQPAVVLHLAQQALAALPPEVWTQLMKAVQEIVLKVIFREPRPTRSTVLRAKFEGGDRLDVSVPPDADPETVDSFFQGISRVIRASRIGSLSRCRSRSSRSTTCRSCSTRSRLATTPLLGSTSEGKQKLRSV